MFDVHRMRRWRIGREPGLRAFTREKMRSFYRNFYRPANTILSISGDVDPDAVTAEVTRLYGALDPGVPERDRGPDEPERSGFRYTELAGDIAQTQLVMGWRTPGTLDPDTPVLDAAAAVLGNGRASRLYRAVRERQLAASVSAYDYTPTELGVFVLSAEAEPEKATSAARAMWHELRTLREQQVPAHELERVRRIFEARWVRRLETAEGRANHLAEWEALGDWRLGDQYFDRFMAADAAAIQNAVARHLAPDRAAALVYRPESAPAVASDAGAMRALLEGGAIERLAPIPTGESRRSVRKERATFERGEAGVMVFRTENGVPVLIRRKPGAAMAHVALYVAGGGVEEQPELAGLTLLTARTMLKGTANRTAAQLADDSEMLGATISAVAGSDSFGWSFSVPKTRLDAALELLGDVITRPTFPDDAIETERTAALSSISMLRDDMHRYPMKLAREAAFHGHPYGLSSIGTEESMRSITKNDMHGWHDSRVLKSAAVIGIVCDLEPSAVADLVAGELAQLVSRETPRVEVPEWTSTRKVVAETREKAQTALAVAFPAPARTDESRFAASLIATVASGLGGRFFDELRDRQSLAYTVQAGVSERRAAGMFVSYIATSPEKESIARDGLLAEFAKLRDVEITEAEITRAKEYVVGSHAISRESGGAVLGELLDAWMFGSGLAEMERFEEKVRGVTAGQMRELAVRYFDPERRVEGIIRGVGRAV
jgi:zinc protease